MSKFWGFKRPRTYLEYGVAEAQWRDFQAQGDFHPPRAQRHPAAPSTPSTTCPSPQSSQSVGQHARDAVMDQDPQCGRSAPVELGAARQSWHLAVQAGSLLRLAQRYTSPAPSVRSRSMAKGGRAQCLGLVAGRRKSAYRSLTQTSYERCAATPIWSKTNWRLLEHPSARLRNRRSLRFDYQPAEPSTLLRMAVAVTLLRAPSRTLC